MWIWLLIHTPISTHVYLISVCESSPSEHNQFWTIFKPEVSVTFWEHYRYGWGVCSSNCLLVRLACSYEDELLINCFLCHSLGLYLLTHWGPRQNGRHFPDIFKYIFFNEYIWITLKIWLEFVPKFRINNIPALVQIMAWHTAGDKPLSEPMMV